MSSATQSSSSSRPLIPVELQWLTKQIRPYLHWHLTSFICFTVGSVLALLTPLILKWLIDGIIPHRRIGLLWLAVALIFVSYQGRIILTSIGTYLTMSATQRLALSLRVRLVRHLDTLSADYYDETGVGAALYPLKEPIDEISYFGSDLLPAILRMLVITGFTVATMLALSPVLSLSVLPLVPVFLVTRHFFRKQISVHADAVQKSRLVWSDFLQEHLCSMISIRLLAKEQRQERKVFQLLGRAVRSQQALWTTGICFTICSSLAVVLAMCAVIAYGGMSVVVGTLSLGSLVAFYGLITQLFDPLSGAADLYARAQKTFASIRQVQSVFALRPSVANTGTFRVLKCSALEIEFRDVQFGYRRQQRTLQVPDLRILPGEHIAIAGENGAGKSTLAKLIVRLYDPVSGTIRLGGEDLRDIDLKCLHQTACYLTRDPALFDGSIVSNLRFVRPAASRDEVEAAIRLSGLSALIERLPDGLKQRIGPEGCQLSGGERQRLALARAILQRPRVLILDEATSCLDPLSEEMILQNLRECLQSHTLILISHRMSTFSTFRRVLVLAEGRIVSDGPPGTLLDSILKHRESRTIPARAIATAISRRPN